MEQDNKKRRTGQTIAFYTALAVCLIAVGVGTWEALQPEKSGRGAAAVSSAVALPNDGGAAGSSGGADAEDGASVTETEAVSGADIPTGAAADIPTSGAADGTAAKDSEAAVATNAAAGTVQAADAKPKEVETAAKPKDSAAKTEKSDAKPKDSGAKSTKDSKPDKADAAKTEKPKLSGEVTRPVEGNVVTGFSMDKLLYNETMRDWRTHDGVDIAADAGTAVVAARPGTVESVTADPIMGTTVVIRHEDKWESVYASLADMAEVEAGDEVTAGQVLGFVGETAASESALGPHLHFSALNDGTPVDPETFLA